MGCAFHYSNNMERVEDDTFVYLPHRIGNHTLIFGKKTSSFPFQLFVGPEWQCMLITYTVIIIPTAFFFLNIAIQWGIGCIVGGSITLFMVLICFSLTACSDPGIIFGTIHSNHDIENGENVNVIENGENAVCNSIECHQCNIKRPKTAVHCYKCNLCIDGLDHHCPWTGKCIGRKTITYFYCFLWTLVIHIGYVLLFVIITASMHLRLA